MACMHIYIHNAHRLSYTHVCMHAYLRTYINIGMLYQHINTYIQTYMLTCIYSRNFGTNLEVPHQGYGAVRPPAEYKIVVSIRSYT
jgi:hypothetical protein